MQKLGQSILNKTINLKPKNASKKKKKTSKLTFNETKSQ